MNLNHKTKQLLKTLLKKLEESTFNENDIINLLRYLRPIENKDSLIWEFACFVAHTEERTRGFIHQELDLNYAKLIFFPGFKTTVSGKFNVLKIEKKLFKLILDIGLKEFPEKDFKENTGINKMNALRIIKESYKEEKGFFYLNKISAIKDMSIITNCIYCRIDFKLAIKNELLLNQLN